MYTEPGYPTILFAKDGEVYPLNGKRCIAIGGAYSVDKVYRLIKGWQWWEDEQPSQKIKAQVEERLEQENWKIDVVLSHTCPLRYEPREAFLPGIPQEMEDKSTETWLEELEQRLEYREWYCGHYHIDKDFGRLHFLYEEFCLLRECAET